jgi:serine/threonine protein kinase
MVDGEGRVKIGDFGMTRDVYQSDYYKKHGAGPMPVRWMPPESLRDGVFTHASDAWSYGIVLWEILTLGAQPYPGRSNEEVLCGVIAGQMMDLTTFESSPRVLIDLMGVCWQSNPSDRPRFEDILSALPAIKGYEILV